MTAREAAGVLDDLDGLSDADVAHLLDRVLVGGRPDERSSTDGAAAPSVDAAPVDREAAVDGEAGSDHRAASDLAEDELAEALDRLDDLGDDRVDALLDQLLKDQDRG